MNKLNKIKLPTMESEIKSFILKKLQKYSSIPSLSGEEFTFLSVLLQDFDEEHPGNWRKVYYNNSPFYFYRSCLDNRPSLPYFLITHSDRVSGFWRNYTAYIDTIKDNGDLLTGQLDNIVGIAIARYLTFIGIPIDILFTTKEELVKSTYQVVEVCKLEGKTPITIDIDVFDEISEFKNGLISLRFKDNAGDMLPSLVTELQSAAMTIKVPYTEKLGYAVVETGFLASATNNEYRGAHIGLPLINYHSDQETASWKSVFNIIQLLKTFFEKQIKGV
jgi:hypothetical protein